MTTEAEWRDFKLEPHTHSWSAPSEPKARSDGWFEVTRTCTGTWYGKPCPVTTVGLERPVQ